MSPRKEIIGDAELWLGDARELLPSLSADAVITDPPYAANTHDMAKTNKGKGHGTKLITFGAFTDAEFADVLAKCLAASSGWVVMTCDLQHAAQHVRHPAFVRLGAWVKPNPMPQISADRPGQGFETVLILHSGKVQKQWNRGGASGVWTVPVVNGAEVPTQKPLRLASHFVCDFTNPGDTVLDPFLGSGTTAVASLRYGRRFVGVEADPTHFDIARRRIEAAVRQPDLFVSPPPKAEQLSLMR